MIVNDDLAHQRSGCKELGASREQIELRSVLHRGLGARAGCCAIDPERPSAVDPVGALLVRLIEPQPLGVWLLVSVVESLLPAPVVLLPVGCAHSGDAARKSPARAAMMPG